MVKKKVFANMSSDSTHDSPGFDKYIGIFLTFSYSLKENQLLAIFIYGVELYDSGEMFSIDVNTLSGHLFFLVFSSIHT